MSHKYHRLVSIIDPAGDYHYYESGLSSISDFLSKFFQSCCQLAPLLPWLQPISGLDYSNLEQQDCYLWDISIDMQNYEIIISTPGYCIHFYYR